MEQKLKDYKDAMQQKMEAIFSPYSWSSISDISETPGLCTE